jgi:large subunit ribosomal protein L9
MSKQIILTSRIESLGAEGDTINVADGYARNYLFPRGLAMPASAANLKRIEALRKKREASEIAALADAKEVEAKLTKQSFTITAAAGQDEKLFARSRRPTLPRRSPRKASRSTARRSCLIIRSARAASTTWM